MCSHFTGSWAVVIPNGDSSPSCWRLKFFTLLRGTARFSLLGEWLEPLPYWPKIYLTLCHHQENSPQYRCIPKFLFPSPHQRNIPRLLHMRCAIACLKEQHFLSPTFFKIQRSYIKNHVYLLFHWSSGENCIIFTFSLHKGQQIRQIKKKHE